MLDELNKKIAVQESEIHTIKALATGAITSIDKLTEAVNEQIKQFAVYAEKHDRVSEELKDVKTEVLDHGKAIAAMQPVVDGIRGLVWKVIFASVTGGTGVAVIVAAITSGKT